MKPAAEIQDILNSQPNWKGELLAKIREVILECDAEITEVVKWRMPSKPLGSISFEKDGIVCIQDYLKSAVRITFPKGAAASDPSGLFNCRLDSKQTRGIDFLQDSAVDFEAFRNLVIAAIALNTKNKETK